MKKPRLENFKRDVYDGQDYADWYKEYYQALEKYIKFLEDCREYDASGENRPDGYILANHHTGKRQSE